MPSEEPDNQANEHQSRNFFAAERTELADDRTLLAWYRTTFAAYALAVGLGGIVPVVAKSASSAYRVLGVIFAVLGAIAALVGVWHYLAFRERSQQNRVSVRLIVGIGLITSLLGLVMAIVIALGG